MKYLCPRLTLLLVVFCAPAFSFAIAGSSPAVDAAWKAAEMAMKKGPADIPIAGQATLKLPKGFAYIPTAQAGNLMRVNGNQMDRGFAGLVMPVAMKGESWFVVITYNDSGNISDGDAKDWNADELLESYRQGTEAGNEARRQQGIAEWEVGGWVEKPQYDEKSRRLVWAISVHDKGNAKPEDMSVNYNTLALGREGYISMNLVTGLKQVEKQKPAAQKLLANLTFNPGRQYTDFNSSTDKAAGYGLAALITGVAAKKMGLFAIIAAFAAKFAKVIAVAALGLGAAAISLFKRDKDGSDSSNMPS